tara:strand:+ start:276 stop:968 length:693 start_codon:yes stop_codon:yes gene_type:complete
MNKSSLDFFLNENIQVDLNNFIVNLISTLILCLILRYIYIKFSTTLSNKDEFSKNFVILGLTTCIVITIVKSSLALSLGLVGALSIVRFRAAIKEPEELVYLFLVIAIGLGNGAGQIKITLVGTIIAFFVVIVFSARRIKDVIKDTGVVQMSITIEKKLSSENVNKLIDEIKKQALSLELISLNKSSKILTINLNLNLKSFEKLNSINDKIIKLYPSANIVVGRDHNISL